MKSVGTRGPNIFWAWALFEEAQWSKSGFLVRKTKDYELHKQVMTVKAEGGGLRRNIPSAKQSKDQDVCPIIRGNVRGSSIDKDIHCERTG